MRRNHHTTDDDIQIKQLEELLTDPITLELLEKPVTASDTYTYSRQSIEKHIETNSNASTILSPMTGEPLRDRQLIPNKLTEKVIQDFFRATFPPISVFFARLSKQKSIKQSFFLEHYLQCPLSREPLGKNPCLMPDGYTYNAKALREYYAKNLTLILLLRAPTEQEKQSLQNGETLFIIHKKHECALYLGAHNQETDSYQEILFLSLEHIKSNAAKLITAIDQGHASDDEILTMFMNIFDLELPYEFLSQLQQETKITLASIAENCVIFYKVCESHMAFCKMKKYNDPLSRQLPFPSDHALLDPIPFLLDKIIGDVLFYKSATLNSPMTNTMWFGAVPVINQLAYSLRSLCAPSLAPRQENEMQHK